MLYYQPCHHMYCIMYTVYTLSDTHTNTRSYLQHGELCAIGTEAYALGCVLWASQVQWPGCSKTVDAWVPDVWVLKPI